MKNYPLSTFQKEQYTQYLETQLEKFSAFMLSQRKENEKYNTLETVIGQQSEEILRLSEKIRLLELYQKENFRHCQKLQHSASRTHDFDHRLKKVQSMYFQKQIQKENYERNMSMSHRNCASYDDLRELQCEVTKKIKVLQKKVCQEREKIKTKGNENSPIQTAYSDVQSIRTSENFASKYDLKKVEQKLHGFFEKNFNKIERMIRKSVNKRVENEKEKKHKNESIQIQQHTFAHSYNKYNDYEMNKQFEKKHEKSSSISEASGRLYPVQYYSQKDVERDKRKRISRSKSAPKQNSRSKSKSRSVSQSKSVKRKNQKQRRKQEVKTPIRQSHSKSKSRQKLNSIKEYKKLCKKKHF